MSAIFGVVHFDGSSVDPAELISMRTALVYHGAGGDLWCEGSVGIGQRLLPFTPPDIYERQPVHSADGALTLVSDARLDNRSELLSGADPLTPDGDLLLQAYTRWGPGCLQHLIGVFAFAIWDARAQSLFAARSPIVAPSFVYTIQPGCFAFATMPGALHALPQMPRSLDETGLARWLSGLGGTLATTLYKNIFSLPTGHWLMAGPDGVKTESYWHPDLAREVRFGSDEEYLAAFNELFGRVVHDHLRSTTPVAIEMSGGLDSSSLGAVAASLLASRGEKLVAFTEVPHPSSVPALPSNSYGDETPYVEAIAALYPNLALNLVRTDGLFFLAGLDKLFVHLEGPFRNTSNRVWIEAILDASRRRSLHVLLDGMQGNLTMSWNGGGWLFSLLHHSLLPQAVGQLHKFARTYGLNHAIRTAVNQGLLPVLPEGAWQLHQKLRGSRPQADSSWLVYSPINPQFAVDLHLAELARGAPKRLQSVADLRLARYEALTSQDFGSYLSAYRAMYGVDMRSPTADVRLAEFCLALPEEQYFRDGVPRSFIRRAMAGRLPPTVLANRKRGRQAADWFERLRGAQAQVAAALADIEESKLAQHVLDLRRMRQLLNGLPSYSANDSAAFPNLHLVLMGGLMIGSFIRWFEQK